LPFGFLSLPEPPEIPIPIPDFRTVRNTIRTTASPELSDRAATEFLLPEAELRQQWPEFSRLPSPFETLARRS
jgi:Zn-dependent peptidase ImmA (M78 family)